MIELISPNVTRIEKTDINVSTEHTCVIYPNGVIEITPQGENYSNTNLVKLRSLFKSYEEAGHLYGVTVTGLKSETEKYGSHRFCTMDRALAEQITDVVNDLGILQQLIIAKNKEESELHDFVGCSSYFRFMRYVSGGEHFPHYDSDFQFQNTKGFATRYTMVMYFTNNDTGAIAFVEDKRENHNNSDWDRQATDEEITLKILPQRGKIVLFPHDLPHTVLPYTYTGEIGTDKERIIARGDLVFNFNSII